MTIELDDKRQAILDAEGHILVLGGPGSGKTTIALLKVKTIFPTLLPGQKLLFLSFSRAAVRQVLTRCRAILTAEERRTIEVKTYHAFCMEFLESHGRLLTGKPVSILYPTEERLTSRNSMVTGWANGSAWRRKTRAIASTYSHRVLERSAALRELLASCYPTLVVDEFQDTDDEQWRIVQALAEVTRVFCLADADQRIFEYRDDVNPKRIETLHAIVAPETFDLGGDNHRSPSGGILGFADAVLKNKAPLPEIDDVKAVTYWPNAFAPTVHAAVIWTLSGLAPVSWRGEGLGSRYLK